MACLATGRDVRMQYLTAMNNQPKSRGPRGKGQPKAAAKRNANRARRVDQDLSVAFSAGRVYGDVQNLTWSCDSRPLADAMEAFSEWLATAADRTGTREFATLTIIRSLVIDATTQVVGAANVTLSPATSALGLGPAFRVTANRSRARMSFAPGSFLVHACAEHFRTVTNLPEPSPSWRREGVPLGLFAAYRAEDLLVASAESAFTFTVSVTFIRPDRVMHILPVLRSLVPADARPRAVHAVVSALLPAGAAHRADVLADIQPGRGTHAAAPRPAPKAEPGRTPGTPTARRRLFEEEPLI